MKRWSLNTGLGLRPAVLLIGLAGVAAVVVIEVVAAESGSGPGAAQTDLAAVLEQREEKMRDVYRRQTSSELRSRFEALRDQRAQIEDRLPAALQGASRRRLALQPPPGPYLTGDAVLPVDQASGDPDRVVRTVR